MTQRNNPDTKEKVITTSKWVEPKYTLKWPMLYRTQTVKKDLDKHMFENNQIPTTNKEMLQQMEKKK